MATDPRTNQRGLSDLIANPEGLSRLTPVGPGSEPSIPSDQKPNEQQRLEVTVSEQPAQEGLLSRIGSGLKRLTGQAGPTKAITGIEAQQKDLAETAMKSAAGAAAIDQLGQAVQQAGQELEAEAGEEAVEDLVQTQAQAQILQAAGQQMEQTVVQQQQQLQVQQLQQQAVLQEQRRREERQKRLQKRRKALASAQTSLAKQAVTDQFSVTDAALASFPGTDVGWGIWKAGKWFKNLFS